MKILFGISVIEMIGGIFDAHKIRACTPNIHIYEPRHDKTVTFYICENKGADQLRSNCEADQRLSCRHTDSTFPLLSKFL